MTNKLSIEQRRQILIRATLRAMENKPALVVDMFDLNNKIWKDVPNNPYNDQYAKPWALEYFEGPSGSLSLGGIGLVGNGIALTASVPRFGGLQGMVAGGAIAIVGTGMQLYRDSLAEERTTLGKRLLNEDYNLVASMVASSWTVEKALNEIAMNQGAPTAMRTSARKSIDATSQWRKDNFLPDQSTPLEVLLQTDYPIDLSIKKAAEAASTKHDPKTETEKFESEFIAELQKIGVSLEDIKVSIEPLAVDLKERLKAKMTAVEQAESERKLGEFVATGQVLGLLIGLGNPKAGNAISTMVEQSAVLYKTYRAMESAIELNKAIQMTQIATGLGAFLAIASCLSAFGGGGTGPSTTEVILSAIEQVFDGLNKIGAQIEELSGEISSFSARTGVGFASLSVGIARVSGAIQNLENTINAVKQEDIEVDLFNATRDLRFAPSYTSAIGVLKEAYTVAIKEASRLSQTGESTKSSALASMIWELSDNYRNFPERSSTGHTLRGGTQLLSTAIEFHPTLLGRAAEWFLESDPLILAEFGVTLSVQSGLEDELSSIALADKRVVSPQLTTTALAAALDAARILLVRPDLAITENPGAELHPAEMLRDIAKVVQWPYRVVNVLGAPEIRYQARIAYHRSLEKLMEWVLQARLSSTDLLNDWSPVARCGVFMGVEQLDGIGNVDTYRLYQHAAEPAEPAEMTLDEILKKTKDLQRVLLDVVPSPRTDGIPDTAERILRNGEETLSPTLTVLIAGGLSLELSSLRAWVDQPLTGHPEWFGSGEYHETFILTAKKNGGQSVPILYFSIDDTGSDSFWSNVFASSIDRTGADTGPTEYHLIEYYAGRNRRTKMWEYDEPNPFPDLNFGPFTDHGYGLLNDWLDSIKSGNVTRSFSDVGFDALGLGMQINAFAGTIDISQLAMFEFSERIFSDIEKAEVGRHLIPSNLLSSCFDSWLNMVTVELCSIECGAGNIDSLRDRVFATPAILRGDSGLLAVFGDKNIQQAFWGRRLAALLDPLQVNKSQEFRLFSVDQRFFAQLRQSKYTPNSMACSAFICSETLQLHIPYLQALDQNNEPLAPLTTCLALTHRAIAASNAFGLLEKQCRGWG
jgi:hypothetical protein